MNRPSVAERSEVVPGHWEAVVRSWPDNEALSWARRLMPVVMEDAAVDAVVATGSAVRNVERSDDLDLVLVYRSLSCSVLGRACDRVVRTGRHMRRVCLRL